MKGDKKNEPAEELENSPYMASQTKPRADISPATKEPMNIQQYVHGESSSPYAPTKEMIMDEIKNEGD